MSLKKDFPGIPYPARAWVYFAVFTGANALLFYGPLGLTVKLWVFLLGVLLPMLLALFFTEPAGPKEKALFRTEILPPPPPWLGPAVVGLGAAIGLGLMAVPGNWPTWDDSLDAYHSVELLNRWRWIFLFPPSQHPPLFNWIMAFYDRLVPPSLTALWLYPKLLSIAALVLAWVTARRLFSTSFAFLGVFLAAVNFWSLYVSRFCQYLVLLVFWEYLTLAFLAVWAKRPSSPPPGWVPLVVGTCVAVGFWAAISWPVVALAVSGAVIFLLLPKKRPAGSSLALYLAPVAASCFLFVWVWIHYHNGVHIRQLWAFSGKVDVLRQCTDSLSNFTVLFWGCDLQNGYGPVSGGVLNPLEGACFFLGVLEAWRHRKKAWAVLLAGAFFLLMAPGWTTRGFDLFRDIQVLPLLLLVTALGAARLLLGFPAPKRAWALAVALPCLLLFDLHQTLRTYQPSTSAFAKGFPILRAQALQEGPGDLLFELRPHISDLTLAVATYTFNPTVNPHLDRGRVRWMAVVVDAHDRPFLERRFPGSGWFDLYDRQNPDLQGANLVLGIIPLDQEREKTLEAWRRADQALRDITWAAANLPENGDRSSVFTQLDRVYPLFEGDLFLESIYWEWVFNFQGWEMAYGDKNTALHYPRALHAVQEELKQGYPTALFYNELGALQLMGGDVRDARDAFEKAVQCPVNLTRAADNLEILEALGKASPPLKK